MDDESTLKEEGAFRVVDQRRFTAEGLSREESVEAVRPQTDRDRLQQEKELERPSDTRSHEMKENQSSENESPSEYSPVDFSSFIVGVASQGMVMLGEVPDPRTGQRMVSLEAVRETIDLLALLEEKTRGNLTAEEVRLLSEILATLRLAYVGKVKAQS